MPKYSSHLICNFTILSGIFLLYLQYPFMTTLQAGAFLGAYLLGTIIASPDLDCKSEASQRCGVVCIPYRKLSKHRGLSHHPLWGMILRIGYFMAVGVFLLLIVGASTQQLSAMIPTVAAHPYEILAGIGGLFVSNLLHILLDKMA